MCWIKHRYCNSQADKVFHIQQKKNRLVQSNDQRQQIDGDYKLLTCYSIVISFLSNHSNHFISLLLPLEVYWWVYVYTLKSTLSLLHPVKFQLLIVTSNDAQRRKRALMGRFSHFQFLTFFNRYMFKLLICILFVRKLYTSVLKYGFV